MPKTEKKHIKVRDLKPSKDAKGGGGEGRLSGDHTAGGLTLGDHTAGQHTKHHNKHGGHGHN